MSSEINLSDNEVVETVLHSHHTQDTTDIRKQIAGIENEMENLDLGSSSQTDELKKLGSDGVWEHYVSRQGQDGTEWAICKYCTKELVGSINIGTRHLQKHFERCAKKRNIIGDIDEDEDHKPAKRGRTLTDPIPLNMVAKPLVDAARIKIKNSENGDVSLLDSIEADYIIQVYKEEKERLGAYLKNLSCRLSLSIRKYSGCYLFSVHIIDDHWHIKEKLISIKKIEDDSNILKCLKDVLLEWGIDNNISSIIYSFSHKKDAVEFVMNSNEIKSWFTDGGSLLFAGKFLDIYSLRELTDGDWNPIISFCDCVVKKMYNIFDYVQKTSSNEQNFQIAIERAQSLGKEVTAQVIPEHEWEWEDDLTNRENLEIAIGYKEAFFELENLDTEFKLINLTKEEWDKAPALKECLEVLSQGFSHGGRGNRTAVMGFVFLCESYTRSLLLLNLFSGDDEEYFNWLRNFMGEYWSKSNLALAAAAVLDPRFKLNIVEYWYKKIYGSEWERQLTLFKDYFTDVYDEYARLHSSMKQPHDDSFFLYEMLHPSGRDGGFSDDLEDVTLQKSELDLYLNEVKFPSFRNFKILNWWRVNEQYFPILARMARDFLSIDLRYISKSYHYDFFLVAGNHLHSHTVKEAFVCTKKWLKSP